MTPTFVAAALLAGTMVAAPAQAVVQTFATYTATGGSNVRYLNSGNSAFRANDGVIYSTSTPTGSAPGAVLVNFSFLLPELAPFATNISALWTFNAVVAKGNNVAASGAFVQSGLSGSFSLISTSAITLSGPNFVTTTYAAGSNLLSGTFSDGSIVGTIGGTSGGSFASGINGGGTISFTSDFLDFSDAVALDRAQSLTAARQPFSRHLGSNGALAPFRAVASGQFSSDPAPLINALTTVPEPTTWAMLVAGFGLVGFSMRRRTRSVAA